MTKEKQSCEVEEEKIQWLDLKGGEWLSVNVSGMIYNTGKARILNVLEAILPVGNQLWAARRMVEAILSDITRDVRDFIDDSLDGYEFKIGINTEDDVSPEDQAEAEKEYRELVDAVGKSKRIR